MFWKKVAKLNQQLLPQFVEAHNGRQIQVIFKTMYDLTFLNANSALNKEKQLKAKVEQWKRNSVIKFLLAEHKKRKTLKSSKMQSCMELSGILERKTRTKVKYFLKVLARHGLFTDRISQVNRLLQRNLAGIGFGSILLESEHIAVKQRLVQRAIASSKFKRLKTYFKELKHHWEQVRNINQLGTMFLKMQSQITAKNLLSNWIKFTFRNEKSLFHKAILAKDFHRNKMKKSFFKVVKDLASSGKRQKQAIESKISSTRGILLRLAFRSLAVATLQNVHRKRSEILNRVLKAWRKEVVKVIEDRAIDAVVNEQDQRSEIEAREEVEIRKKKNKNERFMWLLMGKDAPAEGGRLAGIQKRAAGRDYTDANNTEFSSEDLAGEDIAIKSAL